jgi:hypothetical protein
VPIGAMSFASLLHSTCDAINKIESPFLQDRLQVGRFDAFRDQLCVQGTRRVISRNELFVFLSKATIHLDFLIDNPLGPIFRQSRGILVDSVNIKAVLLVEGRAFAEQSIDLFGRFRIVVRSRFFWVISQIFAFPGYAPISPEVRSIIGASGQESRML